MAINPVLSCSCVQFIVLSLFMASSSTRGFLPNDFPVPRTMMASAPKMLRGGGHDKARWYGHELGSMPRSICAFSVPGIHGTVARPVWSTGVWKNGLPGNIKKLPWPCFLIAPSLQHGMVSLGKTHDEGEGKRGPGCLITFLFFVRGAARRGNVYSP